DHRDPRGAPPQPGRNAHPRSRRRPHRGRPAPAARRRPQRRPDPTLGAGTVTGRMTNGRIASLLVALVLVGLGIWLAVPAAGGHTDANAGYVQFYPGSLCRFAPAAEVGGPGCPRPPGRDQAR